MREDAKLRKLGKVRFIGELYKVRVLDCKIMVRCVKMFISTGEEESLNCLCKLLSTIGQQLEVNIKDLADQYRAKKINLQPAEWIADPKFMTNIFNKLKQLSNDKSLSSRTRFALLVSTGFCRGSTPKFNSNHLIETLIF